jgi:RNA polymerase sigma-70 factor (ECF subfamily)
MWMHTVFIRQIERLRRLIIGMGLGADEGEDILQDVYLKALQRPHKYQEQEDVARWLIRVTVNSCLLEFRRRKRHCQAAAEVLQQWAVLENNISGPDRQAIRAEEVEAMMLCLRDMNESLQMPLVMKYFCDLNSNEIGEILELEPGTVRKRLYKGRIILAEMLIQKGIKL